MIEVWQINHAALTAGERFQVMINPEPAFIREMWELGQYNLVAEVDTTALDTAFKLTYNDNVHWSTNERVTAKMLHQRNTSIGDVLRREDGKRFMIAAVGFTEL